MDTESFIISFTHKLKPGNYGDLWTQCSDEARFTFSFRPDGVLVERVQAVDSQKTTGSVEKVEVRRPCTDFSGTSRLHPGV